MQSEAKRSYRIRCARVSDAPEFARLTTELGYPATAGQVAPRLRAFLPLPDHFVAVAAETRGHLLGWIAAERRFLLHDEPRVEIVGLVVNAAARRRGIGEVLVRAVEEWAADEGVERIAVRSNVTRRESHPFYERLGYRREKTQHAYVRTLDRS
jgi:GNAT superfamily N-acetyltransferase